MVRRPCTSRHSTSLPNRALFSLTTASFALKPLELLSDLETRSLVPGLSIVGNHALTFSPDGERLLIADALKGDEIGIAVLDADTRTPVGFIGPLSVRVNGLVSTPPTSTAPNGRLFVIGTRTPTVVPRADSLYLLDGVTLDVLEANEIAPAANDGSGSLFALHPGPAGETVYRASSRPGECDSSPDNGSAGIGTPVRVSAARAGFKPRRSVGGLRVCCS